MSLIASSIASIGLTKNPYSMAAVGYLARQDAPSGMHRLMLYKLQEESLQQEAERRVIRAAAVEAAESVTLPSKKVKTKLEPLVPLEVYERPKFRRPVIRTDQTPVLESLPIWLTLVSSEINSWFTTLIPQWEARRQVIISTSKLEAANDADIRLRLLLLAA